MKWELVMEIEFKKDNFISFQELEINSFFILCDNPILIFIKHSPDDSIVLGDTNIDFKNWKDFRGRMVIPVKITNIKIESR